MSNSTRLLLAFALLASLAGCSCDSKDPTRGLAPRIATKVSTTGNPQDGSVLAPGEAIDFGIVKLRHTRTVNLAVINGGDAPLHVEKPSLATGTAFKLAAVLANCPGEVGDPGEVAVGGCRVVVIEFVPTALGDFSDVLTIPSDDPDRPSLQIDVRGRGGTGGLQACVSSAVGADSDAAALDRCSSAQEKDLTVDFGTLQMNAGNVRKRLSITNLGEAALTIENVDTAPGDPADFSVSPPAYAGNILPGKTVELEMFWRPGDIGPRTATVTVAADDPATAPVRIHLTAKGDGTRLCLSPESVDFGTITVDQLAGPRQLNLQNCGTGPLTVSELAAEGDPTFSLQAPPSVPFTLAEGEAMPVAVVALATSVGSKTGSVRVASSEQVTPVRFAALKATASPPSLCKLEPVSTVLDFGSVVTGTPATRALTLHNAGTQECVISAMQLAAGAGSVRFYYPTPPTVPFIIPAGELHDVRLTYMPMDAAGPDQSALLITANDPTLQGSPMSITLRGTPMDHPACKLEVLPPKSGTAGQRTLNFGTVGVGDKKTLKITLKNVGTFECGLRAMPTLGGMTGDPSYKIGAVSPAMPGKIQPGETATVEVIYQPFSTQPTIPGNTVSIRTTENEATECTTIPEDGCKLVSVMGTAASMGIDVVPHSLDFGLVTVGCNSVDKVVTVYNIGTVSVQLTSLDIDPTTAPFVVVTRPALPYNLAVGGSVAVGIRYRPQASQADTGTLVIGYQPSGGSSGLQYKMPLEGEGTTNRFASDVFRQTDQPKTDVLLVIDNSGSMSDSQSMLADNAAYFIAEANKTNCDYQIAVTTTTWSGSVSPMDGSYGKADSSSGFPGEAFEPGGFYGTPKIIKRTDADPTAELRRSIKVGECCSDSAESGLEAAKAALTEPMISDSTKANSQFIRDDAKLALIMLSDEEDQGQSSNVQYYVDLFQNIKGAKNSGLFALHAIVGDSPDGCTADVGGTTVGAEAGKRYIEAATRTGGLFRSICTADWGRIAADIGLDAFAAKRQFFLSRNPDSATLNVTVDGAPQTLGTAYDYDATSNSIIFRTGSVPGPGATIQVDYTAACL